MISSFAWLDPRSLRSIIACILQTIMHLRKLESGHAKLGERSLLGTFLHVKYHMWCGISPNMMELSHQ